MTIEKETLIEAVNTALDSLTMLEIIGIESHYGKLMEEVGVYRSVYGVYWAMEWRRTKEKPKWGEIESIPNSDLQRAIVDQYHVDDDVPKDKPNDSPNGVSPPVSHPVSTQV